MSRTCTFVPPYLLDRIASRRPEYAEFWTRCREQDAVLRERRAELTKDGAPPAETTTPDWVVFSADNTETLPGRRVRAAGEPESGDPAVDEAAYGIEGSLALFAEVYGRDSYDAAGASVHGTVHYGRDYANAFWDGRRLVFGDGDGEIFGRFTRAVDVLAHEFTHAVVEHAAGLTYRGQPGALNESLSDVFAACLEQRLLGQSALEGDWLVGAELFQPGVNARALRDMARPGTAYDDPVLGQDPQPAHMDDFVVTVEDNGGVHINSGIPNRAFHLAATSIGGSSAEGAGRIWYAALTDDRVGRLTGFHGFAAATVAVAGAHAAAVADAWQQVGVDSSGDPGAPAVQPRGGSAAGGGHEVVVRRSGGLLGRTVDGHVDLDSDDERAPELAGLVQRIDLAQVAHEPPQPDRYVYYFDLCGQRGEVPEQCLTAQLRRVVELVIERPR